MFQYSSEAVRQNHMKDKQEVNKWRQWYETGLARSWAEKKNVFKSSCYLVMHHRCSFLSFSCPIVPLPTFFFLFSFSKNTETKSNLQVEDKEPVEKKVVDSTEIQENWWSQATKEVEGEGFGCGREEGFLFHEGLWKEEFMRKHVHLWGEDRNLKEWSHSGLYFLFNKEASFTAESVWRCSGAQVPSKTWGTWWKKSME